MVDPRGSEDDGVDLMRLKGTDGGQLRFLVPVGAGHEQCVIVVPDNVFHAADDLSEVGVGGVVDNDTDRLRAGGRQRPG